MPLKWVERLHFLFVLDLFKTAGLRFKEEEGMEVIRPSLIIKDELDGNKNKTCIKIRFLVTEDKTYYFSQADRLVSSSVGNIETMRL